MPRGRFYKT